MPISSKSIDKINDPKNQKWAIERVVGNLFHDEKHDSVIPLINALQKRLFNEQNFKRCCDPTCI